MNELPKGWQAAKLTDVCDVSTGKVDANHASEDGDYTFFTCALKPFKAHTFSFEGELITLPGNGANVGHVNYYSGKMEAYQRTYVLHRINIIPRYLFWQLKLAWKSTNLDKQYGSATNYLKIGNFTNYILPIAPLNEQIRIADKLDSILGKVNKAQSRLDKIPAIIKRFRQTVLAAATSSELTREWREDDGHQWRTVQLKDVGKGFNYGSSAKSKPEGDVPVLRMGNLQGGKLDWSNLVFTSDEAEIEKYLLETGDILFNRTNSPELVGKTSIYRGEQKAIYAGYLIRVKGSEQLNTEFLNIQLNSPHARDYCWQVKTDGVSQSNINAKKLQAYEFDLPPMSEQLEIVRRVNELFSRADLFERQYLDAKKSFNKLTSSILAKAFRGELVMQDPNDEPASQLLERIKSRQLEAPKPTKKARSTKVKAAQKVEDVSLTEESVQLQSEVLSILQNANVELSAQQLMDRLTEQSFEAVDALFTELKSLLDSAVITKTGSGENCTFKAIKR